MKLLSRFFRPRLTPAEETYRERIWGQIEALLRPLSLDEADKKKLKNKAYAELEEHVELARSLGKTPEELDAERQAVASAEHEKRMALAREGYVLDQDDFRRILLPVLGRISFMPDPALLGWDGSPIESTLFEASSPDYRCSSAAKGQLIGLCDADEVVRLVQRSRRMYESIRKAKLAGYRTVHASCDRHACDRCRRLDQTELLVDQLLQAFERNELEFPHELPWTDSVRWCPGPALIF